MGPGGRQGLALFPLRPKPESPARAAAGGVRAARLTGGSRRLAPLTRFLLPTDSLRTSLRLQGWIPSGLRSGRGGGGGHRRLLDPPSCGRQKARARGSVWSRICALGDDRAGSGVLAEGLHFPEGSGTAVSVLGASAERGERTAGLPSRPRSGDHSPPDLFSE